MAYLPQHLYSHLRRLLAEGPRTYPQPYSIEGFRPAFKQCHVTALRVAQAYGWPRRPGIQFLDLAGKLYPWPHYVNERHGRLCDFSGGADQHFIGFVPTADDLVFQAIIDAYNGMLADQFAARWTDPLAQRLSDEFFPSMKASAPILFPQVLRP